MRYLLCINLFFAPMRNLSILTATLFALFTFAGCHERGATPQPSSDSEALLDSASSLTARSRADEALPLLDSVIGNRQADDTIRAMARAEKANTLLILGRMQEALPVCRQAISEGERLRNDEILINQYSSCGIIYRRVGMPDSALWAYRRGIEVAKRVEAKDYVANLYNNIAVVYVETDRYAEGVGYADTAAKWAREAGDSIELYSSLATKSAALLRQKKYDKAASIISSEFDRIMALGSTPLILKTASPMLSAMVKSAQHDAARHYLRLIEPVLGTVPPESNGALGIFEIRAQLLHEQQLYKEELQLWQRIDRLSQKNKGIPQTRILASMADCLQRLGRPQEAYTLLSKAYVTADSLKNSDVDRQLSEFSVRYKTQEKELQIERLRLEKTEQRARLMTIVWSLVLLVVVLAAIVALVLYRRRLMKQKHELDLRRSYIEGLESERLRLAKELHDGVCNDLLGIQMLMAAGSKTCSDRLTTVTQNVRQISHELMPPSFDRCDILTIITDYVENYPLPNCTTSLTCSAQDALSRLDRMKSFELYRILQELLGNVARHASAHRLSVDIAQEGSHLKLTVENDGADRQLMSTEGIGTCTTAERVHSMNGDIKTRVSEDGIYHVEITL